FFQAEDGIRDRNVTGVQTCALPICLIKLLRSDSRIRCLTEPTELILVSAKRRTKDHSAGRQQIKRYCLLGDLPRSATSQRGQERSEERRVGKEGRSEGGREE